MNEQFPFAKITVSAYYSNKTVTDPRLDISKHISWTKSAMPYTDFSYPEPDNFNHAVLNYKSIECPLPISQVFYKEKKGNLWWSVYCVEEKHHNDFIDWLYTQKVVVYWYNSKNPIKRHRRQLLWHKKSQNELTDNERLLTMGYYADLKSKYFCEDNKMFDSRIGIPREGVYDMAQVDED